MAKTKKNTPIVTGRMIEDFECARITAGAFIMSGFRGPRPLFEDDKYTICTTCRGLKRLEHVSWPSGVCHVCDVGQQQQKKDAGQTTQPIYPPLVWSHALHGYVLSDTSVKPVVIEEEKPKAVKATSLPDSPVTAMYLYGSGFASVPTPRTPKPKPVKHEDDFVPPPNPRQRKITLPDEDD